MATRQDKASTRTPSAFANALRALLDETGLYSRDEWAQHLRVTTSAISQWVNDRTVPRYDILYMLVDTLRNTADVPTEPLRIFDELAALPAAEVSPHGHRMGASLGEYLARSGFGDLDEGLRGATRQAREALLTGGSLPEESRKERILPEPARVEVNVQSGSSLSSSCWALGSWEPPQGSALRFGVFPDLVVNDGLGRATIQSQATLAQIGRVLVCGQVGTGKSFLMAHALAELGRTRKIHWHVPSVNDGTHSTPNQAANTAVPEEDTAVYAFDGIDQLPGDRREKAVQEILELARRRPRATVWATSRDVEELKLLTSFQRMTPAPFNGVQLVRFVDELAALSPPAGRQPGDVEQFVCRLAERRDLEPCLRRPLFLKGAWSLFSRHAVSPFAEAEVLAHWVRTLADEWDLQRDVFRTRTPWTSLRNVQGLLGEIASFLATTGEQEFPPSAVFHWLTEDPSDQPTAEQLLLYLRDQTGLVERMGPKAWRMPSRTLQTYLAAAHLARAATDMRQHLQEWPTRGSIRDVLRLSCGIVSDATPLLAFVLDNNQVERLEKARLIIEMLAQPLRADRPMIERSCHYVAQCLDDVFRDWHIEEVSPEAENEREAVAATSWQMVAETTAESSLDERAPKALAALHRARSGIARVPFQEHLSKTQNAVLESFGESLAVDGQLHLSQEKMGSRVKLRANVGAPLLC